MNKSEMIQSIDDELENIQNEVYFRIKRKIMERMLKNKIFNSDISEIYVSIFDENIFLLYTGSSRNTDWVKDRLIADGFDVELKNLFTNKAKIVIKW